MTECGIAAFCAGIRHAAQLALIAALSIEQRDGASEPLQRAAVEALRGLAEGLRAEAGRSDALSAVMARIAQAPSAEGNDTCPRCAGRLRLIKDASNSHVHARCESADCIAVMQ